MKKYAVLQIQDDQYSLMTENGETLLKGSIQPVHYIMNYYTKLFNDLSMFGWDVVSEMDHTKDLYLMCREVKNG